jgi:heme/copper-type cytochrome/quinol oxidase subunit 1
MWLGKPVVKAPVVWALATALMAFVGGAVGVLLPIEGLELRGTVYELSLYNYVLLAGLLGGLGGLVYWGPKLWGRRLPDGPALGLAGLGLVGVVLVAFPDVIAGFLDQPFGAVDDLGDSGALQILNIASFAGVVVLVVVVLALLALALTGFRGGPAAGDDPWEGATLEWATTSPPPDGNFATAPAPVRSAQPLLDAREESAP